MIKQLKDHLTEHEIETILKIIKSQYKKFLRFTESTEFTSIFSDEYAPHKKQHTISWAISSAFPSGKIVGESLVVERLLYGKGHTRPILSNKMIELHILNKTTDFESEYLKKRYQYNTNNFSLPKLFAYIMYEVKNKRLISITLCLPDETGVVIERELLMSRDVLQQLVA